MPSVMFGVTVPVTANTFLRDQIVLLSHSGWDVHLVVSNGEDYDRLNEIPGLTLHPISMQRRPSPRKDIIALLAWIRTLRRVGPDLIIASTPKAGLLGMLAARICNVPTRVYHLRGLRAEGLTGIMRCISLWSEQIAITCSTSVQVDSPSLLVRARELGLLREGQGVILGNGSAVGVDTLHYHPPSFQERKSARDSAGLESNDIAIGFVGRIVLDKGILDLITAVAWLRNDSANVQLVLVGAIDDENASAQLVDAIAEHEWIKTPGPTDTPLVWYHAFDIFCLPSYREGFPTVNLEASACGLPIVTTDVTGCRDSIVSGVTGILSAPRDPVALKYSLQELVQKSQERQRFGKAGREWVSLNFNKDRVLRAQVRWYADLAQD